MPFWNSVPAFTPIPPNHAQDNTFVITPDDYKPIVDNQEIPALLPQFEWSNVDIRDPNQMQELFSLLYNHYIEDVSNKFRLHYSIPSLEWALCPPGYVADWHIGIRVKASKKLVAFISAIPLVINIHSKQIPSTEVNFLCIHPKLRSHHLAPLLIGEVTRRIGLRNVWTSVYTTGTQITKPLVITTFYHRPLNIKKLVDHRFTGMKPGVSISSMTRLYSLPDISRTWRRFEEKDVQRCFEIFTQQRYSLMPVFTMEEFQHWLLPRQGVISSHVLETNDQITDFLSYYLLKTTVIGTSTDILSAYSYYSGTTTLTRKEMMEDALILAKTEGCDVFTSMDATHNEEWLKSLRFIIGTGRSHYYIYNWQCREIPPGEVGLILP